MQIKLPVLSEKYPQLSRCLDFLHLFYRHCRQDQIQVAAGYLSYVTVMSLVPLMVVMLSIMSAFPKFQELRITIENFVYANFVPTAGDVIREHLSQFVSGASRMSAVALTFLFLFALLLISAIDKTLNRIWKINQKRRLITSFSMYWMILTLGPVLVGSSIAVTSYVVAEIALHDVDLFGIKALFLRVTPLLASIAAFMVLYLLVPNKVVPVKHAFFGAAVAGILFELAKKAFAVYVTQLPSYEAIYGALATIPILFLWIYLSWTVVLIGAEFTVSLEQFSPANKPESTG